MSFNMVADHAVRSRENDLIFTISKEAKEAVIKNGVDKVINSTMGVLLEDNGDFVAFKSVYDELKSLDNPSIAAYASIEGDAPFLEAVTKACFGECMPNAYIKAVATPGGSGAIHHSICDYTALGDTVITSNWYWDPYKTICEENLRKLDTFNLFNENNIFNMDSFKEKFTYYLDKQKRLLTILNTPAHNPTGYTITDNEWDEIIDIFKEKAKDKSNKIILLVDVAYIDFCEDSLGRRKFFKKFENLPDNIIVLIAFSASKGYTMYGLRNGALICITSNKEISEEFFYTSLHSNRGTWSNGTKSAMQVLTNIIDDKNLNDKFIKERNHYKDILNKRAKAFIRSCVENDLKTTPYSDGFFISIPCDNPMDIGKKLNKKNVFTIPLQNGLRFALCAVNEEKCMIAPKKIKSIL